jgi:HD-GYP domain-containing protein (c-di-GMP phosphodiesterase class II)
VTGGPGHGDAPVTPASLVERCRLLGLPVWRFDVRGALVEEPGGHGKADPWLRAPALRDRIDHAVQSWLRSGRAEPLTLWSGCRLVPVGEPDDPEGLAAALMLGADGREGDDFEAICRSARLDPKSVSRDLSCPAAGRSLHADGLEDVVEWMRDDLRVKRDQEAALQHFSKELTHNYEEVSLLYRLGRSMNWLTKPEEFMATASNCILPLLDFAWIAVVHKVAMGSATETALSTVLAGTPPCSRGEFDEIAQSLLGETTADNWTSRLEPDEHPAAARLESQLIAEPVMAGGEVVGLILAGNKIGGDFEVTSIETQLLDATADYLGAFLHNVQMYEEQRRLFMGSIQALAAAIDAKDRYTRGHSERVALMGSRLAAASGMSDDQVERIRIAGLMHDVGKIGVREAVLRKPGKLTDAEFDEIKRHPVIGHTILKDIAALADVLPGVLYHHERWDGRGYPEGIGGEDIPLFGRVLAVVDAFDAMSSNRAYRPAIPREAVRREIADGAGTQFDPELARLFLTLDLAEYDAAVARHHAQEAEAA